jgi:hypothetical protein
MDRLQAAGAPGCVCPCADGELFHPAHAGRYFGGMWFKVFSERGPC